MIKKIAKFFAWLIGGLTGLAILLYLVLLIVNWRDVPPSGEAMQFTEQYTNRLHVADEKNSFVYMTGMPVAPAMEPMQAGLAMIERARNQGADTGVTEYSHPQYPLLDFKKDRTKEIQYFFESCSTIDEKCLTLLSAKSTSSIQPGTLDTLLLKRYRSLIAFQDWQDIYPQAPDGPLFPRFTPALDGQLLSMLDIWQHAESRGAKSTIALLDEDAIFWRKVLNSSDSLITSMVAASALRKNILWSNLVMRRLSSKNGAVEVPTTWRHPISDEERLMKRAWVGEWMMTQPMARHLPEQIRNQQRSGGSGTLENLVTRLLLPLYQPQDNINLYAHDLASSIDAHNVPYEKLSDLVKDNSNNAENTNTLPRTLYNPLGRYLHNISRPDNGAYFLRMVNLEGGRRALLAILEIRSNNTSREKIADALADSSFRDPYTNKPFSWDEASGSIVFEGLGEGTRKRYIFPL